MIYRTKAKIQAITKLITPSFIERIKITVKKIITKKTSIKAINISALFILEYLSGLIFSIKLLVLFAFLLFTFKDIRILIFFIASFLKLTIVILFTRKLLIILNTSSILKAIKTPIVKAVSVELSL